MSCPVGAQLPKVRPHDIDTQMPVARRDLLRASVAIATAAATGSLLAQGAPGLTLAPRSKGPLVWLGLDQAELDAAYNQVQYAPNQSQVLHRYAANSESVRGRVVRRGALRMARALSSVWTSTCRRRCEATPRSTYFFTAVHGATDSRKITHFRPRCSSPQVRTS